MAVEKLTWKDAGIPNLYFVKNQACLPTFAVVLGQKQSNYDFN